MVNYSPRPSLCFPLVSSALGNGGTFGISYGILPASFNGPISGLLLSEISQLKNVFLCPLLKLQFTLVRAWGRRPVDSPALGMTGHDTLSSSERGRAANASKCWDEWWWGTVKGLKHLTSGWTPSLRALLLLSAAPPVPDILPRMQAGSRRMWLTPSPATSGHKGNKQRIGTC